MSEAISGGEQLQKTWEVYEFYWGSMWSPSADTFRVCGEQLQYKDELPIESEKVERDSHIGKITDDVKEFLETHESCQFLALTHDNNGDELHPPSLWLTGWAAITDPVQKADFERFKTSSSLINKTTMSD